MEDIIGTLQNSAFTHAVALDMKSWFNQFALTNAMRQFMCVKRHQTWWAPTRLPMGMRHSCLIAQRAIDALAGNARLIPGVKILTYIDNVLIVGSKENVRSALKIFLRDSDAANCTINDIDTLKDLANGVSTIPSSVEYCGIILDLVAHTAKVRDKTLRKMEMLWQERHSWTFRLASGFCSSALFSTRVLAIPKDTLFHQLNAWRKKAKTITENHWDEPCVFDENEMSSFDQWRSTILKTNQLGSHHHQSVFPVSGALMTDACASDWAGIWWPSSEGGHCHTACGKATCKSKHSSVTEPWAVFHAAVKLIPAGHQTRTINVFSDNEAFCKAANKGLSRSWHMNKVIGNLRERFPSTKFRFVHIDGHANLADPLSREKNIEISDSQRWIDWISAKSDIDNGFSQSGVLPHEFRIVWEFESIVYQISAPPASFHRYLIP